MLKQNQQKKKCKTNKYIRYTKLPHDTLLDISYKFLDIVFKGGTRDYITVNKQVVHHGNLRKELITYFLSKKVVFYL